MDNMSEIEKKYKHLLLKERAASEQYRLNYEKLKALTLRLQLEKVNSRESEISKVESKIECEKGLADLASHSDSDSKSNCNIEMPPVKGKQDMEKKRTLANTSKAIKRDSVIHHSKEKHDRSQSRRSGREKTKSHSRDRSHTSDSTATVSRLPKTSSYPEDNNSLKLIQQDVALNHWKAEYANLSRQNTSYKEMTERLVAEQTSVLRNEIEILKDDVEMYQGDLTISEGHRKVNDAELKVVKNFNKNLEIEVEELKKELVEQRIYYQARLKKIEDVSLPKEHCSDISHQQLQSRLSAAEIASKFYKKECQLLRKANEAQLYDIVDLKSRHDEEERQMKGLLMCVYTSCVGYRDSLQNAYQEIDIIINGQQDYAKDLSAFVEARERENTSIVEDVCQKLRDTIIDGKSGLQIIENTMLATVGERKQLEDNLQEAISYLEAVKMETDKHGKFTASYIKDLYRIMDVDISASRSFRETMNILYPINNPGMQSKALRSREEQSLKATLGHLHRWKIDKEKEHLNRISELKESLSKKVKGVDQKLRHSENSKKLQRERTELDGTRKSKRPLRNDHPNPRQRDKYGDLSRDSQVCTPRKSKPLGVREIDAKVHDRLVDGISELGIIINTVSPKHKSYHSEYS